MIDGNFVENEVCVNFFDATRFPTRTGATCLSGLLLPPRSQGVELWKSMSENTPNDLSLLNEQDDVDGAIEWLLHGKIDAKHLAKSLPHTTQDLRDGKTSSEQLFESLKPTLNATLKVRGKDGFEGSQMEFIAHRLSSKSIPDWWCRNEEQTQWLEKAHAEFARDFYLRCESMDQLFCGQRAPRLRGHCASDSCSSARNMRRMGAEG